MDSGKDIKGWELNHKHSTLEDDITKCFSSKMDCSIEVGKFAGAERGPAQKAEEIERDGRSLRIIICKRPAPLDDHLQEVSPYGS